MLNKIIDFQDLKYISDNHGLKNKSIRAFMLNGASQEIKVRYVAPLEIIEFYDLGCSSPLKIVLQGDIVVYLKYNSQTWNIK